MPTTNYIWDPLNDSYLMETDGHGAATALYTQEPALYGGLVSQVRATEPNYFHQDHIGSTRLITNGAQSVTDTFIYDAWGSELDREGTTETPFCWGGKNGYYSDGELSGFYVRARVYNASSARWMSRDRFRWVAPWYLYNYALNSPIGLWDPSGLIPVDPIFSNPKCRAQDPLLDGLLSTETQPGSLRTFADLFDHFLFNPDVWLSLLGYWTVIDLNTHGPDLLDRVRTNSATLEVQSKLDAEFTRMYAEVTACKGECTTNCGIASGIKSFDNIHILAGLGRYSLYWKSTCKVSAPLGPKFCFAPWKCNLDWMLYDVFDFDDWLHDGVFPPGTNLLGTTFVITASWSTVVGGLSKKSKCCCTDKKAADPANQPCNFDSNTNIAIDS